MSTSVDITHESNVDGVNMQDTSIESGPDSTSNQFQESHHAAEVDDTEVEVKLPAQVDGQHKTTRDSM